MRILADENIEFEIIKALRDAGVDVISVRESYIGVADDEVLGIAVSELAIILTHDADFGELVFRFGLKSKGVILLRFDALPVKEIAAKVLTAIRKHAVQLEDAFTVISRNSIRIRKGSS